MKGWGAEASEKVRNMTNLLEKAFMEISLISLKKDENEMEMKLDTLTKEEREKFFDLIMKDDYIIAFDYVNELYNKKLMLAKNNEKIYKTEVELRRIKREADEAILSCLDDLILMCGENGSELLCLYENVNKIYSLDINIFRNYALNVQYNDEDIVRKVMLANDIEKLLKDENSLAEVQKTILLDEIMMYLEEKAYKIELAQHNYVDEYYFDSLDAFEAPSLYMLDMIEEAIDRLDKRQTQTLIIVEENKIKNGTFVF